MTAAYAAVVASSASILAEDLQAKPIEKSKTATLAVTRVLIWEGLIAMISMGAMTERPPQRAPINRLRIPSFRANRSRLSDLKCSITVNPLESSGFHLGRFLAAEKRSHDHL
ncbi:MAG: hypothetical protein Q9199_005891 [Rusavskia elegans]